MTMDDYLAARPTCRRPFGLFDCDMVLDGSIALVVSHEQLLSRNPNRMPTVEAIGGAYGSGGWFHRDDFPKMASSEDGAGGVSSRADLTASDVNVAEIYDSFTLHDGGAGGAAGSCADGSWRR